MPFGRVCVGITNCISRMKVVLELHRFVAKIDSCLRRVVNNCEPKNSKSLNEIPRETVDHVSGLCIFRNCVTKTRVGLRGNFFELVLVLDVIAVLQFLAGLGPQQFFGRQPSAQAGTRGASHHQVVCRCHIICRSGGTRTSSSMCYARQTRALICLRAAVAPCAICCWKSCSGGDVRKEYDERAGVR